MRLDVLADSQRRESKTTVTVGTAESIKMAKASENTDVTIRVAELETSTKMEIAARAVQKGNYREARRTISNALGLLRRQNAVQPSPRLRNQIRSFEDAASEMEESAESVSAQKAYTKKFKARAYKQSKR